MMKLYWVQTVEHIEALRKQYPNAGYNLDKRELPYTFRVGGFEDPYGWAAVRPFRKAIEWYEKAANEKAETIVMPLPTDYFIDLNTVS